MRKKIFAALGLAAAAISSQADVLITEEFENISTLSSKGWVLTNASTPVGSISSWYQGDSSQFSAYSGSAEGYIAANFNNAAEGGVLSNWLITPTFSTETAVTISFYALASADPGYFDQLAYGLSLSGSSNTASFTLSTPVVIGTSAWTKYTVTLAAQGAGTQARFAIQYTGLDVNANYVGVDSLTVTAVPEPSTYLLFGAGALALGLARRRQTQAV